VWLDRTLEGRLDTLWWDHTLDKVRKCGKEGMWGRLMVCLVLWDRVKGLGREDKRGE
jgi:hypothetical protein